MVNDRKTDRNTDIKNDTKNDTEPAILGTDPCPAAPPTPRRTMPDETSFGSWLKQHRKTLDLTQAELARLVGCATVTMHKIEADGLRPSRQLAEQLAVALEIPPDAIASFLHAART